MKLRIHLHRAVLVLAVVVGVAAVWTQLAAAAAAPLVTGQVLAGIGSQTINQFTPTGTLVGTLNDGLSNFYDTGMCFDSTGNLYGTNFDGNSLTKWDATGAVVPPNPWTTNTPGNPESCAFDASGNMYVGQAASNTFVKLDSSGALLATYTATTEDRGTDWLDLAADQHTVFYTSEGSSVMRFDVATNTQLTDFATGLAGPCFALRIRPNGDVMVACESQVYLFDSAGAVLKTYAPKVGSFLFALNLDPNGTAFWTADIESGEIWEIDIATGAILQDFISNVNSQLAGLAVVGEIRVAVGDTTPPMCSLSGMVAGPPKSIQITVQDAGGLASIVPTTSVNASVSVPVFAVGDTSAQIVVATKTDQTKGSTVGLTVTDKAGNVTKCDPNWPGKKVLAKATSGQKHSRSGHARRR